VGSSVISIGHRVLA